MRIHRNYGYQAETFKKEVGEDFPYLLIGAGLMPRKKYDENNAPTDEIASMVGQVYYPKKGVLDVKFPADYVLPTEIEDMSRVKLINPQACVMNGIVYGKADGIEPLEEEKLSDKKARGFLKGNILKYATRYDHKDGTTKDLLKAEEYLQRLIVFEEEKCVEERQSQIKIKAPSPVPTKNTPLDKIIELGEEYYPWLLQHPEIITGNAEVVSSNVSVRLKAGAKARKFKETLDAWYDKHVVNKQLADNEANACIHASRGERVSSAKFKVTEVTHGQCHPKVLKFDKKRHYRKQIKFLNQKGTKINEQHKRIQPSATLYGQRRQRLD